MKDDYRKVAFAVRNSKISLYGSHRAVKMMSVNDYAYAFCCGHAT